jgi:hypothetical protein
VSISAAERRDRARLREKKRRSSTAGRAAHNKYRNDRNASRRGAYNTEAREQHHRRQQQRDFFSRRRQRQDRSLTGAWYRAGCSVVNRFQLENPLLIFELNGKRTFERWEDTVAKTTNDKKTLDQLEQWNVRILQMADAIEADVAGVARHTGCPAGLILDALTIELTGRFIGRIRQRDEQMLKTQPII